MNLNNLSHTQKVKFNYILAGRNSKGLLEEYGGIRLGNGVMKMPMGHSIEFEDILKSHRIKYKQTNILEEI